MEFLLVIGGIWFLVWVLKGVFGSDRRPIPRSETTGTLKPRTRDVYRPRPARPGGPPIAFGPTPPQGTGSNPEPTVLEGLHDAFTGAPLNPQLGLHQCTVCTVYYHTGSVTVLREENGSRCVACGSSSIVERVGGEKTGGRDYSPDVVTLANYQNHFDRVVTFEGHVKSVKISRRGMDFAVMFEHASWTKGLKLVFFRGAVGAVGGQEFISGLQGRTVRVRGLLIRHPRFGPEIIISERSMVLSVSS